MIKVVYNHADTICAQASERHDAVLCKQAQNVRCTQSSSQLVNQSVNQSIDLNSFTHMQPVTGSQTTGACSVLRLEA